MSDGWAVMLNGVMFVSACDETPIPDCGTDIVVIDGLDDTPDGLGLPGLRTEDVTYFQRDGVKHFNDWYEPRIITLTGTIGPGEATACHCLNGSEESVGFGEDPFGEGAFGGEVGASQCQCLSVREQLFAAAAAWERQCCDGELVVFPPCDLPPSEATCAERTLLGPYGLVGRPRGFTYKPLYRKEQIYEFIARFDAVDQRAYLLDECGTPGVSECVQLAPGSELSAFCEPICADGGGWCANEPISGGESVPTTDIVVCGTQRAFPTITFNPMLNRPTLQNVTTGEFVTFGDNIAQGEQPVVIYTEDMTAWQGDTNVTYLIGGSGSFSFPPGDYELRLLVSGALPEDPDLVGNANVCWRPAVAAI